MTIESELQMILLVFKMNTSVLVNQIFIYTHISSISFTYSWKMGHGTTDGCAHDL
jgi:hypothetical protein